MGRLDGKVAVITGGSSGIGNASVRLFIKEGAQVVFGDIQDELGKALAEELGSNAIYLHANVRNESEIKALIDNTDEYALAARPVLEDSRAYEVFCCPTRIHAGVHQ